MREPTATYANQRNWLRSTSRDLRRRTTTAVNATTMSTSGAMVKMVPLVSPPSAGTTIGLGMLGNRGESWVVVGEIIDPATSTSEAISAVHATHRHLGLGNLPFGKKKIKKTSRNAPIPPVWL
jgi:hypothetical protein